MKCLFRSLMTVFGVIGLVCTSAWGGTAELNQSRGIWDLNNSLDCYWSCLPPLQAVGFTPGGASPGPKFATGGTFVYLDTETSLTTANPRLGFTPSQKLMLRTGGGGNGPSTSLLHNWSVVMDVRLPVVGGRWISLLQDTPANNNDAEIFVNTSGALQFIGATNGTMTAANAIAANTWYRLAFTSRYDSTSGLQVLKAYINGAPVSVNASPTTISPNGRYAFGGEVPLFADDNNETAPIHCNSVAFWALTLSDADIVATGTGPSASGVGWSGLLNNSSCPMPPLTGKLYWGDFLTTFSPGAVPLLEEHPSSSTDVVFEATMDFAGGAGKIPNMPRHTFDDRVEVQVLGNGDCRVVSAASVIVDFNPPSPGAADAEATQNIVWLRSPVALTSSGAYAALQVLLPGGFGVGVSPISRKLRGVAVSDIVKLKALLLPATSAISLAKKNFTLNTSDTGFIYPSVDRVPVYFKTSTVTWDQAAGTFSLSQEGDLVHHREYEYLLLQTVAASPNNARASNDGYFVAAKTAPVNVIISSRVGLGAKVNQLQVNFDANKYGTGTAAYFNHYPLNATASWNGSVTDSKLTILNDNVSSVSKLTGTGASVIAYNQGCLTAGCDPQASSGPQPLGSLTMNVDANGWLFTQDGGLRAEGTSNAQVRWGAYQATNLSTQYAHTLTPNVAGGRMLMGGIWLKGDEASVFTGGNRVSALLLSGHSSPTNAGRLERPGTATYLQGQADYPGYNIRVATNGALKCVSRLAEQPTSAYDLRNTTKYYLAGPGVSGKHDSIDGVNTTFNACGGQVTVSALRLQFLDSQNKLSGVNGSLTQPAPASFGLSFSGLRFGCRGELLGATLTNASQTKRLGYWNMDFTPVAIDFAQPKACPPPPPADAFLRVTMRATMPNLAQKAAVGSVGFYAGDIVTEREPLSSDGVTPLASGLGPISRFTTAPEILIPTPSGKAWRLANKTGIYLNRYAGRDSAGGDASQGTLNVMGMLNLPFFVDTPAFVSTSSSNLAGSGNAAIYIRKPWIEAGLSPEKNPKFDEYHVARAPGMSLDWYRAILGDAASKALYDLTAEKKWLDIIPFSFAVRADSTRTLSTVATKQDNLVVFRLEQAVPRLTPDVAELQFDGELNASLLPQINVSSLLADSGLFNALESEMQEVISSIPAIDELLADTLEPVFKVGTDAVANQTVAAIYTALQTSANGSATLDANVSAIANQLALVMNAASGGTSIQPRAELGPPGSVRKAIALRVTKARSGIAKALTIAGTTQKVLNLAAAIKNTVDPGNSVTPSIPDSVVQGLSSLTALLSDLDEQFSGLETALGGPQQTLAAPPVNALQQALAAALGNASQLQPLVQLAINDVKLKWAATASDANYFASHSIAELREDISAALLDRLLASTVAGAFNTLLRQWVGDPVAVLHQAVDDLVRQAQIAASEALKSAVDSAAESSGLGALSGNFGGAKIQGYARINGDSLQDLRLDGQVRLKMPDANNSLNFDGYLLIRSLDSSTPEAACLAAGGAKTEVAAGASTKMKWGTRTNSLNLEGKVALDASGAPIGLAGGIALGGEFDFEAIKLTELKFGFGLGAGQAYAYGAAAGSLEAMAVKAGLFIGKTCDVNVVKNADPDIGGLLADPAIGLAGQLPLTGAVAYAQGSMSLMPILGIPPSCVLDLRIGGGQGYFGFLKPSGFVLGYKQSVSISGELLCLVDVGGELAYVLAGSGDITGGRLSNLKLAGQARATVRGEVGYSPFSWDFEKSITLKVQVPGTPRFRLDY